MCIWRRPRSNLVLVEKVSLQLHSIERRTHFRAPKCRAPPKKKRGPWAGGFRSPLSHWATTPMNSFRPVNLNQRNWIKLFSTFATSTVLLQQHIIKVWRCAKLKTKSITYFTAFLLSTSFSSTCTVPKDLLDSTLLYPEKQYFRGLKEKGKNHTRTALVFLPFSHYYSSRGVQYQPKKWQFSPITRRKHWNRLRM